MSAREIMAKANYETIGDDFATALAGKRILAPDWSGPVIGAQGQAGWLKAADAEIQALTEAGYTIEQWIEFDPEDEATWPEQAGVNYLCESIDGRFIICCFWPTTGWDIPRVFGGVKRYKAITP